MSPPPSKGEVFERAYLTHDEVSAVVQDWAKRFPEFVRLRSLAKSTAGRDVWLLEIGREPDRSRPAVWIDGNIHAAELLGCNVALGVAQALVNLHAGSMPSQPVVPEPIREAALNGLYYVVPRISPDGAEEAVVSSRISRSAPRDRRRNGQVARWVRSDVDGDGTIRQMRIPHPAGEFVRHPQYPDVLVAREITDAGPFYKVFPEGYIEGYDGIRIPFPATLSDNDTDFNRSFPSAWRGDADGAGHAPTIDPETRAIADFASSAPHIFAWINLHTFGGVFIRPPFTGPDNALNREDLVRYQFLAQLGKTHTGLPTICAFDEMTPNKAEPMTGTLASWAHEERGCFSWALELWDVFADAGIPRRTPFFRSYALESRDHVSRVVEWDRARNGGRVFGGWKPFSHDQLGPLEVGGIDPIRGFWNPPEDDIKTITRGVSGFAFALAALAPKLEARLETEKLADGLRAVRLRLANTGYLPTYVTAGTRGRSWNGSIEVAAHAVGCRIASGPTSAILDHLPGWGRGADEEMDGPFFQKSSGVSDTTLTWVIEGAGGFEIRLGCPRVGWQLVKESRSA